MKVDIEKIESLVKDGWIKKSSHPHLPLSIYNYSEKAQYERYYIPETIMCRGIVLDTQGNVIGRPWSKFFNMGEPDAPQVPNLPFITQEKLDGSLIVVFSYDEQLMVTSRGSWDSWYQKEAQKLIQESGLIHVDSNKTHLFELIHPHNRIVIDYKGEKTLYHLATIDNETGEELDKEDLGFPHVPVFDFNNLKELPVHRDNREGFVLTFSDGTKLKTKHEDYIYKHRVKFLTNEKTLWEMMVSGKKANEIIEELSQVLPEESIPWLEDTVTDLDNAYRDIEDDADNIWEDVVRELGEAPRKDYAMKIKKAPENLQPVLFNKLSGKDSSWVIFKQIKPKVDSN